VKELKTGLVVSYHLWPGKGTGLFSEEKINKERKTKKIKKAVSRECKLTRKRCT